MPAGPRHILRRAVRLAAVGEAAPAVAGALITTLAIAGRPAGSGPLHWTVVALCAVPGVLVHWRGRAVADRLTWSETAAAAVAGGAAAYAVSVVGLVAGAALAFAVVVAVQTGALAVAVHLTGLVTAALTVRAAVRRPAPIQHGAPTP